MSTSKAPSIPQTTTVLPSKSTFFSSSTPAFDNRTIFINGGTHEIGLAIARYLASHGANIAVLDITHPGHLTAVEGIQRDFPTIKARLWSHDPAKPSDLQGIFPRIVKRFPQIDGAVNCAGVRCARASIKDITDAEWQRVQDRNVLCLLRFLRWEIEILSHFSSIVNITNMDSETRRYSQQAKLQSLV